MQRTALWLLATDQHSKQLAVKGIVRSTVWHGCVTSSCEQLVAERAGYVCCSCACCVHQGVKALCCCLRTKLCSRVVCRMGLQFPASAAAAVPAIYGRL